MITNADTIHDALRGKNIIYRPVSFGEQNFEEYTQLCLRDEKFYYNPTFMRIPLRLFSKDEMNPTGKVYCEICDIYYKFHDMTRNVAQDVALELQHIKYENRQRPDFDFLPIPIPIHHF